MNPPRRLQARVYLAGVPKRVLVAANDLGALTPRLRVVGSRPQISGDYYDVDCVVLRGRDAGEVTTIGEALASVDGALREVDYMDDLGGLSIEIEAIG